MHHVSAYIEILTRRYSAPTVKQHLAAIRRLFDWLIVGRVIDQNPAAPVRGPTHVVKKGKTPVLLARRGAAAARQHRRVNHYRAARSRAAWAAIRNPNRKRSFRWHLAERK